jgi:hypothetical protein
MKLWLISQDVNNDYDTYDSAVVIAETEEDARRIIPSDYHEWGEDDEVHYNYSDKGRTDYHGWAFHPDQVKVKYIGEASPDLTSGIVVASFRAG